MVSSKIFNGFQLAIMFLMNPMIRSLPIFQEPTAPFYGLRYNTRVARKLLIPGSAHGTCEEGKIYRITSGSDLMKYTSELQCIFTAGLTPSKVPEGPMPGRLLLTLNADNIFAKIAAHFFWRGKFVFKAECNRDSNETTYIGFNNILSVGVLPFQAYIAPLLKSNNSFAPAEYEDEKPSLILDFTKVFSKMCPNYPEFVTRNKARLPTQVKTLSSFFPVNQIYDVLRFVGRQADGASILLGKTYAKDAFRSDNQMASTTFWYLLSYDQGVNPDFLVGQELPPQDTGYKYTFPGSVDTVLRVLPFDNFLYKPIQTFQKVGSEASSFLKGLSLTLREYFGNAGRELNNRWRLMDYFHNARWNSGSRT